MEQLEKMQGRRETLSERIFNKVALIPVIALPLLLPVAVYFCAVNYSQGIIRLSEIRHEQKIRTSSPNLPLKSRDYDKNKNGILEPDEMRAFLESYAPNKPK